ncbi:Hypothetical protein PHPALM_10677 [Phytophthora palmivora]|uniref:Uncharacterized protein n=1 Tax=Phytophthora palmivora TaxID=4796 RepID=A0A2P4Y449_9STRA|nr:Hypothetical protein PHPALM_10677 [Phytophthora palmivora]
MSDHGHDGSQHGSGRHDPPSPRPEIGGSTGGSPEHLRRSVVALRRRVLRLSDDLRLATRRADEAVDRNREHVCSLESLEMMCATQGREVGRYRAEFIRDALQSSLESDRILEPPQPAPEISALEAQIVDLNRDLDRRSDEIHQLEAHIDDLCQDRGRLESTIRHLTSEMTQAGGEILDLQQANHDLDRSREDAESALSATEESLRRTRSELDRVEAELLLSRSDRADRESSGFDPQSSQANPQSMGPTQADLDQITRERDSLRDQIRARDVEILSAQRTLGLLQSDLAAHRARSTSDTTRLQTLEGDLTRARNDVDVAQKAYADRERTITENQAQIRTLSRDLGKVVRERDALRHEYTAAFQRLTSISATIGAPPPQTQLRLDPGSDTDQPAGGIPRSPSAETSGSGSDDSNSDAGSGDQGNGSGPTGGSGPANPPPGHRPPRITFVPQVPFPEGRCIPGRRIVRVMAAADIDPWIESRLANQTLITMTVNFLFPILPFRPDWIFPHRPTIFTSPTAPAFCGHLITEANVKALQAAEPWRVIRNTLPPISFEADVGGRLGIFLRQYRDFEASELIAYWESTHKFPITAAMIAHGLMKWLGIPGSRLGVRISLIRSSTAGSPPICWRR